MEPARYRTSHIARASNMPQKKLERLLDRGVLTPSASDIDTTGSGRFRYFTVSSARKIAVANLLMDLGVKPTPAGAIAEKYNHKTGLLVIDPDGNATIQSRADFSLCRGAVLIDLDNISADVESRLAKTA